MGDGNKERLSSNMQMAVRRHRQYCEDYVPEGILRETAIKTVEFTMLFRNALVAYIKDEYQLLLSFKLLPKHVLLLLSNQFVQICDGMYDYRNKAANVDLQNPVFAATRFAWVTLQSLGAMEGYLKDKFCLHQAININSTFIRFLTRHMAEQVSKARWKALRRRSRTSPRPRRLPPSQRPARTRYRRTSLIVLIPK
jgi:hypothetical protein